MLPDGYEHDTTVPGRPWICPVRSCRRLFKTPLDFGNHFKVRRLDLSPCMISRLRVTDVVQIHHRGARLNDNLDGTFSVLNRTNGGSVPVVVSRNPTDSETLAPPMRPTYPRNGKSILWVRAAESEPPPDLSPSDPPQVEAPILDLPQVDPNHDLEFTADGRPYREWQGEPSYAGLCSRVRVLTRRPF